MPIYSIDSFSASVNDIAKKGKEKWILMLRGACLKKKINGK